MEPKSNWNAIKYVVLYSGKQTEKSQILTPRRAITGSKIAKPSRDRRVAEPYQ